MAKKVNKTNEKRTVAKGKKTVALTVEQKNKLLLSLCVFVAVCILATLVFGLKLYAYGKDVKIVYSTSDGTSVAGGHQIVEVCKKYKLKTPKDTTGDEREFLYWSTNGKASGKVDMSGIWLESTDNIILYAVWGDGEWSNNY